MPVSGNEEHGGLARQSTNSLCVLPIKKRLSSMFYSCAPSRPDRSFSNENESKTKDSGLGQISTLNSHDSTGKSDTPDNSLVEVKEERSLGAKVDSHPTMLPSLSISPETNPNTTSGPSRNVDNLVKPALTQKLASQEDIGTTAVTAVKKEVIVKQGESDSKLELPANSRKVELSLGLKKPYVSSLVDLNAEGSGLMRGTVNPLLLSLSLNKEKDISQEGSCKNGLSNNDTDDTALTNRSNWDLNTPMDSWEGSGDVVPVQDASQIDPLRETSSSLDIKPPISYASFIGSNGDQGKQVVGASEQEFDFPISSIHPTLRHKSVDVLRFSLGSTLRGFDSLVMQSLAKVPSSCLPKNQALSRSMNSPTCKTVKSEPVEEAMVQAHAGRLEANVGKPEVVRQNLQSSELSTKGPQELLEQKPMKCEPLHEVSQELSMTSNVIEHQSVGRGLQLQESSCCSSSSSTLPMPLTPQQGCASRLSTCSDLSVSGGDLSTPSEYSVHTNESKSVLDQANAADMAAKNANSDLKELNVSSDKVEASVSVGKNTEDHMVYKKTQDPHNLVVSGEVSANDGEKISISAGSEEECYGSDYESDGHHAFVGHVDTESVGCVREDEEYEDGEVREPMMQSIAQDPIAERTNSEKNKESSIKNAHFSSGFSGVGESHCFANDQKGYSMPVHTECNDDFAKGCDVKAEKIDHKDSSPLLDKEETTGDDEQRPIGATYQGSVDQSGIAEEKEGREKDVICVGPSARSREAGGNVGEVNNEYIRRSDMSATALSSLPNAETPVNATSSKDLPNFGSKSRIITLPHASDVTFSSNFKPVTDRSLSSRSGRERYSDTEEEKFHLRRNRDEIDGYGPKFVRDRCQDRSFSGSKGNFMRGRERSSDRFDRLHRDRYSGCDFESYGDVADYRFRHKRTAPVGESENERNDYDSRLDGAAFASNRRRKPLNDVLPSFRHPPARRLSPDEREDASMMGIQMLRSAPQNISPSRCTGEDGSPYVGLRHSEKFDRDFPADISNPVYSHQQSIYSEPDGHFFQRNAKITVMQRSGFARMRSKSPVRSRTWSSPRRRLTEGSNGHQESSHHRSRVMLNREDRMRSSPRHSFPEEAIAPQRRDSPSYTARCLNDMRDVDAVQKHGHPRFLSSRRSPPDGVFTRTNRRVEILDHRERADGDGYLDRSIYTRRFPEIHSGESTDERSMNAKRRGGPGEMRNAKEQEGGNLRQSEELWHEDEFEVSKLKKRRF